MAEVTYDAALNRIPRPKTPGSGGPRREEPPQDKLWGKCWLWLARGYAMPWVAKKVDVPFTTLRDWKKLARFKAGLKAAEKAWDQAAIKREIAQDVPGGVVDMLGGEGGTGAAEAKQRALGEAMRG